MQAMDGDIAAGARPDGRPGLAVRLELSRRM
jgi:hypothetical protein